MQSMQTLRCRQKYLTNAYNYRQQIEEELLSSLPLQIVCKCHASRIIRITCNLVKLNLLQCGLLSWLLKRSRYNTDDMSGSTKHMAIIEEDFNKEVLLIVLLNAYYVKNYMAQQSTNMCPKIDSDILMHIPNFSEIYRSWRPDSSLKSVTIFDVNQTFESWTYNSQAKRKADYNELVNRILDLSKTYNVNGPTDIKEEEPKKKRKKNQVLQQEEKDQKQPIFDEISDKMMRQSNSNRPWFPDESIDMNPLRRSTRNMNYTFLNYNSPSKDLTQSKYKLFQSRNSNCMFDLNSSIVPARNLTNTNMRIKPTTSYDQLK